MPSSVHVSQDIAFRSKFTLLFLRPQARANCSVWVVALVLKLFLVALRAFVACWTAEAAQRLVEANHMSTIIKVVKGKVEEIELPEKVDVIVSEPIGFLLVSNRARMHAYIKATHACTQYVTPD